MARDGISIHLNCLARCHSFAARRPLRARVSVARCRGRSTAICPRGAPPASAPVDASRPRLIRPRHPPRRSGLGWCVCARACVCVCVVRARARGVAAVPRRGARRLAQPLEQHRERLPRRGHVDGAHEQLAAAPRRVRAALAARAAGRGVPPSPRRHPRLRKLLVRRRTSVALPPARARASPRSFCVCACLAVVCAFGIERLVCHRSRRRVTTSGVSAGSRVSAQQLYGLGARPRPPDRWPWRRRVLNAGRLDGGDG